MINNDILSIIGSVIIILLSVNAYFIKQLVSIIFDTKTAVAVIHGDLKNKDTQVKRIDLEMNELKVLYRSLSHRLVAVETLIKLKSMREEDD